MIDPRPASVRLANGTECIGLWIADGKLEIGGEGLEVKLRDAIEVDGETWYVAGRQFNARSASDVPDAADEARDSAPYNGGTRVEVHVRLQLERHRR
jgi:hypothetical protein